MSDFRPHRSHARRPRPCRSRPIPTTMTSDDYQPRCRPRRLLRRYPRLRRRRPRPAPGWRRRCPRLPPPRPPRPGPISSESHWAAAPSTCGPGTAAAGAAACRGSPASPCWCSPGRGRRGRAGGDDSIDSEPSASDTPAEPADEPDPPTTDSAASPVGVTQSLVAAVEQGDRAAMIELMTAESWGSTATPRRGAGPVQAEYSQDGGGELAGIDFGAVTLVSETGDDAVVEVEFSRPARPAASRGPSTGSTGVKADLDQAAGG